MKTLPCQVCGNRRIFLREAIGLKRKPYYLECPNCHFTSGNARTVLGAIWQWNKVGKQNRK